MGDVANIQANIRFDKKPANGVEVPEAGEVEVVELLVPGLGPVDRDALLWPREVDRQTGDNKAGFYRSGDAGEFGDSGTESVPSPRCRRIEREVYDWTRLTIGGVGRALWLCLLPFLLINMVAWMQPRWPSGSDGRWTRAAGAVYESGARLLALSLTVLVVGSFGQVAMDEFAWQCQPDRPDPVCGRQAMDALQGLGGPQLALALASLVPAVVAFVMLGMARDAKQEYLPVLPTGTQEEAEAARCKRAVEGADGHPLEMPSFWEHNRRDPGIAAQHVWAGLLTTAGLLTWTPLQQDSAGSAARVFGTVLFGVILAMAAVVVVSVPVLHRRFGIRLPAGSRRAARVASIPYLKSKTTGTRPPGEENEAADARLVLWPTRYPVVAGVFCGIVTAVAFGYCLWPGRDWRVAGQLPGIEGQSVGLLWAQKVGFVLLLLGALCLPKRASRHRMALFGYAGPAMAVLACFLGWLYTVGLAQLTSAWLAEDRAGPVVTEPVKRMGMILVPLLGTAVVCGLAVWAVALRLPLPALDPERPRPAFTERLKAILRRLASAPRRSVGWMRAHRHPVRGAGALLLRMINTEPLSGPHKDEQRHASDVASARRRHAYLLRQLNWMTGLMAAAIVIWIILFDRVKGLHKPEEGARSLFYDLLGTASVPLLAALATLMLFAIRGLAVRPEMRQNAGLAWAFGAFWPRAVHPFAPSAWTTRAVPELVRRLQFLLRDRRRLVLIRSSSMGSVLALTAIWQLEEEQRERIGLITTGCPVRVYFTAQYPGFVCRDSITGLAPCGTAAKLGAWSNVWRDTDPLGGPVGIEGVDVRWKDPAERRNGATHAGSPRSQEHPVFPPVDGHRCYDTDQRMGPLRAQVLERLLRAAPAAPPSEPAAAGPDGGVPLPS